MSESWKAFFYGAFDPAATAARVPDCARWSAPLPGSAPDSRPRCFRRSGATGLGGGSGAELPAGRGLAGGPGGGASGGQGGGAAKLDGSRFGPEVGWLYPLALASLGFGLWSRRRTRRTDPVRAGLIMWGTWLVTFGAIYSVMSNIPHTAYVASLAPPIPALSGAGIVLFWRWYRSAGRLGWVLPAVVAAEFGWAVYLWSAYRLPEASPGERGSRLKSAPAATTAKSPGPSMITHAAARVRDDLALITRS